MCLTAEGLPFLGVQDIVKKRFCKAILIKGVLEWESVATKARAQNQVANVCLKGILRELPNKKIQKKKQPEEPTHAWKHALL